MYVTALYKDLDRHFATASQSHRDVERRDQHRYCSRLAVSTAPGNAMSRLGLCFVQWRTRVAAGHYVRGMVPLGFFNVSGRSLLHRRRLSSSTPVHFLSDPYVDHRRTTNACFLHMQVDEPDTRRDSSAQSAARTILAFLWLGQVWNRSSRFQCSAQLSQYAQL